MKGVINRGMQDLVEAKYGTEAWEEIKMLAGCDELFFAVGEEYPIQRIAGLVEAAARVAGLPSDEVLVELGRHWVLNTGQRNYPSYYSLAGASPRDFLMNLDRLHVDGLPEGSETNGPRFRYEELADGKLLVHYHSRCGFCSVLRGVIEGIGLLFNQEVGVRETGCRENGKSHCTMEVTLS